MVDRVEFLKSEHRVTLSGLHREIERLQDLCRDLRFRCEASGYLIPTSDFFRCSAVELERRVLALQAENEELRRRLLESERAIDILDQKEKLSLWRLSKEIEYRDDTIRRLQQEHAPASPEQGVRRKKSGNFWRRFSFGGPSGQSLPAEGKTLSFPRMEHLSREDLPSEIKASLPPPPSYESSQMQAFGSAPVVGECGVAHRPQVRRTEEQLGKA